MLPVASEAALACGSDVMRWDLSAPVLLMMGIIAVPLVRAVPTGAQQATGTPEDTIDVKQLFASSCGWCHSDGGRVAGKGPKLMDSPRSDDYLRNRIKFGKEGAMPAFGGVFTDAQIDAIINYVRSLKPDQG
jgi:mono/diheme cytochrome c family protein